MANRKVREIVTMVKSITYTVGYREFYIDFRVYSGKIERAVKQAINFEEYKLESTPFGFDDDMVGYKVEMEDIDLDSHVVVKVWEKKEV